jgi:uncharacterized protein YbjT (DUF2867 family)
MKRVLVTGATGFIGGHVAWALVQHGYEVVALVRPRSRMTFRHGALRSLDAGPLARVRRQRPGYAQRS